jgi:hypothetical protein
MPTELLAPCWPAPPPPPPLHPLPHAAHVALTYSDSGQQTMAHTFQSSELVSDWKTPSAGGSFISSGGAMLTTGPVAHLQLIDMPLFHSMNDVQVSVDAILGGEQCIDCDYIMFRAIQARLWC